MNLRARSRILPLLGLGILVACSSSNGNTGPFPPSSGDGDAGPTGPVPPGPSGGDAGPTGPSATCVDAGASAGTPDIGFRAAANGFKFQNYTNSMVLNLTTAELRRFFGDKVCGSGTGDGCTLTPPAAQWLTQTNDGMNGGHCEGMAVTSLLFYTKKLSPTDFGAASVSDLVLMGNEKLQREIAYWFATQGVAPASAAEDKTLTPGDVADRLSAAFAAGTDCESYTVGIYKPGYKEGHAITPYAVVPGSAANQQKIMVYDNNFPGEERSIVVDRASNTWAYEAAADPSVPASQYAGDASTKTLTITPTSARLAPQQCPFCGDATPGGGPTMESRSISTSGQGSLLITDEQGRRLGYDAQGNPVAEIPGASESNVRGGDLWQNQHSALYAVAEASKLTITLDGRALSQASPSDVTMVAPGFTLAVNGVALDPMQIDTLTLSADSTEITYTTKGMETPTVVLGVQLQGADYAFYLHSAGETGGQVIDAKMDLTGGKLKVDFLGTQGASTYDIEIDRIDSNGKSVFKHAGNNLSGADTIYLEYGSWSGDGSPMTAILDQGSDGTMDQTVTLTDQP